MLKEMIQNKGVSVYRVAQDCRMPYTTLNELVLGKKDLNSCNLKTVKTLADYFNLSVESFCSTAAENPAADRIAINSTWEQAKRKKYYFPDIYHSDVYDNRRIHPLKQRDIASVFDSVRNNPAVKALILFGSSSTVCCRAQSDIDLAVELRDSDVNTECKNAVSEAIQDACGYTADIIWMDRVTENSALYNNICRGVKII